MSTPSVATPVGIALGATWNPELVEKVGNMLADEVKAKGAHILLAPTVNIQRTPIAGRPTMTEGQVFTAVMAGLLALLVYQLIVVIYLFSARASFGVGVKDDRPVWERAGRR